MGLSTIDSNKPVWAIYGRDDEGLRRTQFVNATNEAEAFVAAKGFTPEFASFEYAKQLTPEVVAAGMKIAPHDNRG
jgi:hypothetical protein